MVAEDISIVIEKDGGVIDVNGQDIAIGGSALRGPGTLTVTGGNAHFYRPSPDWIGGLIADACDISAGADNALGSASFVNLGNNTLRVTDNVQLPNAFQTADGTIDVGEGFAASTGIVLGGKITKAGAGEWVVDAIYEDVDVSILAGQVTLAPVTDTAAFSPLAGNPAFWVDATRADSFDMDGSGNISRWYDRRTPKDTNGFYASRNYNSPVWTADTLNGRPVVDFGTLGQNGQANENKMLVFKNYLNDIRTVFWVIGSRNGGGFLLGDNQEASGGRRHFHRADGTAGLFGGQPQDPLWAPERDKGIVRHGDTWINTQPVDGTTTGLSGNFDLVAWRLSAGDHALGDVAPGAVWFASCYAADNGRLNGGQELGEVLIFTNRLTDAEIRLVEFYLAHKWFPDIAAAFTIKSISLDGQGATFNNAYDTLHVADLIINASGVEVTGNPMTVGKLTVTGSGELQSERLQTLDIGALEFLDGATITVDLDNCPALNVTGNLTLPGTITFNTTGATKPPPSLLLITASTVTDTTPCEWLPAQVTSTASRIAVTTLGEVWLKTAHGTIIILK